MSTHSHEPFYFEVRKCKRDDLRTVMDINESTLPENYPMFFYEQILHNFPETFLVAYPKGKPKHIIAYIMWRVERSISNLGLDYINRGHLVSLAVLPEYRRKGIAKALMERTIEEISTKNVKEYVLEVRISNSSAINLYQKLFHFEIIKILKNYYRDGEDAFYMCRFDYKKSFLHTRRVGMTEEDLILYYKKERKPYVCYRCPNCKRLLFKSVEYALPGSIKKDDERTLECVDCGYEMKLYDISKGVYDVQ